MLSFAALILATQAAATAQPPPSMHAADIAFRAGYAALTKGDLPAAEADFATAVHLAPRVALAHSAYGAILLQENRLPAAADELRQAETLDPNEPTAMLNLGITEARLGTASTPAAAKHRSLASDQFKRWQTFTAKALPADASVALATAEAAGDDRDAALRTLDGALSASSLEPSAESSLLDTKGTLLVQQGSLADALPCFRTAVERAPEAPLPHLHLGALLLREHQPAAALSELSEASRLAPADDAIALELGEAQFAAGDTAAAQHTLTALHEHVPANVDAAYQLALTLEAANDFAGSIPLFEQVRRARPRDASLLTNLGLAMVQTGKAREAIALYSEAAHLDPKNPVLHEDMGVAFLQQNDLESALREFREGSTLDPGSAQLAYDVGLALKLRDDLPGAIAAFEHAATLDPSLADAPYTLGVIYMQQGRFDEAARSLHASIALRPQDADMWSMLGSVYKQANQPTEAIDALHHAIALQPGQPGNHINLAAVLAQQGDRTGAAAERKIAADLSRNAVNHQKAAFALDSAKLLRSRGQLAEAEIQVRAAITADPASTAAHTALADLLLQQGRVAEAASERSRAAILAEPAQP